MKYRNMEERSENKLERILQQAEKHQEELPRQERFDEEVLALMRQSRRHEVFLKPLDLLFGWIEIRQLRYAMGIIALLITGVYLYQQGRIHYRMDQLEQKIEMKNPEHAGSQVIHYKRMIWQRNRFNPLMTEPIPIHTDELEELMQQYRSLEKDYHRLLQIIEADPAWSRKLEALQSGGENGKTKL